MRIRQAYITFPHTYIASILQDQNVSLQEYAETYQWDAKTSIKVMVAFGPQTFSMLEGEAKERGISVQELLRAVIIPEWFRTQSDMGKNPGSMYRPRIGEPREDSLSHSRPGNHRL